MALTINYSNPGLPVEYVLDSDPTVFAGWGGTNAELASILYRTDIPSIYRKTGPNNIDWTLQATSAAPPAAVSHSAMFFGTTSGTGSAGNDYAATVAVGAPVPFPRNGPASGTAIARNSPTDFIVNVAGVYELSWAIAFNEASQLQVAVGGAPVANTCTLSGAGTQMNTNRVLLSLAVGNLVSIINPAGNATALTVQPADGSLTHAQAPNVVMRLVSAT